MLELWGYRDLFLSGALLTSYLTTVSFAGAVILGTIAATFRISPIAPLRAVGLIYVEIFRNVPLMSLIILVVYMLPDIGILFDFNTSVILAMSLVGGSFICEALRSGINSIDKGQIEAARSIGLSFIGVLSQLVLPQAFRSMVQPMVTVFIGILLSSTLAGIVGIQDLTATVSYINNIEALGLLTFTVAAIFYIVVSLLAGVVGAWLEKRLRVVR